MTHAVRALLLAAVVFMASQASLPTVGGQGQGPAVQVTRFVCIHCTQTGHLSSHGLFLSRAAVNRHIGHAKACRSAGLGYREMPIQIRAVDVMAGGGGGADLRRRSDIKRQVNSQDNLIFLYIHKHFQSSASGI